MLYREERSPGYGSSGCRGKETARCQGQEKCIQDNPDPVHDSVMGRRIAFQCDVLTMVLHESKPLILPRYLMAVNVNAFDLAAYM